MAVVRPNLAICFGEVFPEAGCDEAGRGCLAGPVVAAAVILPRYPDRTLFAGLNDSKQLSPKTRLLMRELIRAHALSYGVGVINHATIDEVNILRASHMAMHLALEQLDPQPEMVIVDGNRFTPYRDVPYECIVKGDAAFLSVAAASVLAKTARDEYMEELHAAYPQYGWDRNKGYPTPLHRRAIDKYGLSPYHRRSFGRARQMRLHFPAASK